VGLCTLVSAGFFYCSVDFRQVGKLSRTACARCQVIDRIQAGGSLLPPRCSPPEVCRVMVACWRRQPDERLRMTEIRRALDAALRRLLAPSPAGHVTGNSCDHEYLELLDT